MINFVDAIDPLNVFIIRFSQLILWVCQLSFISVVADKTVSCKSTKPHQMFGVKKTCMMIKATSIPSAGYSIASLVDDGVHGINIGFNKNIHYLPESPSEIFPALQTYFAASCSIGAIYKDNFRDLKNLTSLNLSHNKIQTIDVDVFDDLILLRFLHLGKILN